MKLAIALGLLAACSSPRPDVVRSTGAFEWKLIQVFIGHWDGDKKCPADGPCVVDIGVTVTGNATLWESNGTDEYVPISKGITLPQDLFEALDRALVTGALYDTLEPRSVRNTCPEGDALGQYAVTLEAKPTGATELDTRYSDIRGCAADHDAVVQALAAIERFVRANPY